MYTVLMVDDKEVFRRKIKRLPYWQTCEGKFKIGYEAQNGLEALECLKQHKIDVVLTDIRMPFIDGIELLKQVKGKNLSPCVVLLSEFAEFSYAKEGILNGAFDYIVRPVDDDKIRETFERAYQYLSTIQTTVRMDEGRIESLAELMAAGDKENTKIYAEYMNLELQNDIPDKKECVIKINDVLKQIKKSILKRQPYLEKYLALNELLQIDIQQAVSKSLDTALSDPVVNVFEQMESYVIGSKNSMVEKMCVTAMERVDEKVSLGEMAGIFYVNQKYLGGLFKQEMGCSFTQYVTFLKMQRAKLLLRYSELRIFEIAAMLGYEDIDYFSKLFKKETGESPSTYRERGNHEEEKKQTR